jgi:hypothetical protein
MKGDKFLGVHIEKIQCPRCIPEHQFIVSSVAYRSQSLLIDSLECESRINFCGEAVNLNCTVLENCGEVLLVRGDCEGSEGGAGVVSHVGDQFEGHSAV